MLHRLAILPLLFVAILAIGCAPSLVDARAAVNRVSETYAATAPALEKQRMAAGDACFLDNPPGAEAVQRCLDGVRSRWRPVEVAVAALYVALVAAQGAVGTAEAADRIGRKPSVAQVMGVVARLLDAAVGLDVAVDGMRRSTTTSGSRILSPRALKLKPARCRASATTGPNVRRSPILSSSLQS